MKKKVVIIGAGPAGLSAAYELLKKSKKYEVVILEESNSIGGIARTVKYHGNRMDIGGHRFFTKIDRVNDFWDEVMPVQGKDSFDDKILGREKHLSPNGPDPETSDNVRLVRQRVSRIYYLKKFFDYPISLKRSTITSLGFVNTIKCGFSYLKSIFVKKEENSLENFYINRFGKKLYSMFFEKYTEKLWGRHPKDISADWGAQRVKGLSIVAVIKNALKINKKKETSLIEEFTYPKYGPGSLWEKIASDITKMNGKILFNHEVNKINVKDNKIISVECLHNGSRVVIEGDIFVSSMPLKNLVLSMDDVPNKVKSVAEGLCFRDFVTIGILVDKLNLKNETNIPTLNNIIPDCWLYIQEPGFKMGRIQIFNNWSPYMVKNPNNTVWIGLEYFCSEGDSFWSKKDKDIKNFAINELYKMGIIDKKNILDFHVEKVKKAYPAYFDTYKDIDVIRKYINKFDNLYCVGRNGQHRYNNMDHSVMTGFLATDHILGEIKDKNDIWNVNTEKEFHEEKIVENKKKVNYDKIVRWILFILFALATFYISSHHEPWRDEAQAWLMSRDMNVIELIKNAPKEGHPILFHLLLKPFVLLGYPYEQIYFIPWIITLISAFVFIKKFPSGNFTKFLVLCSAPFLYFCSGYLRSYTLILLNVVLIASLFKDRYKHPVIYGILLLLFSNIHLFSTAISGLLLLVELYDYYKIKDNRKEKRIIIGLNLLGLFLFLLHMVGSNTSYFEFKFSRLAMAILFPLIINNYAIIGLISCILNILFGVVLYNNKEYKSLFIYLFSTLVLIFILTLVSNGEYMCELFTILLIFVYWIANDRNNLMKLLFVSIIITHLYCSIRFVVNDSKRIFSLSEDAASYINNKIPSESNIYCTDLASCSSILPYLEKDKYNFIDRYTDKKFTYVNWVNYYGYDRDTFINDNTNYDYYISYREKEVKRLKSYELIYKCNGDNMLWDEKFYILKKKK